MVTSAQPEVHAGRWTYGSNLVGVKLLGRGSGLLFAVLQRRHADTMDMDGNLLRPHIQALADHQHGLAMLGWRVAVGGGRKTDIGGENHIARHFLPKVVKSIDTGPDIGPRRRDGVIAAGKAGGARRGHAADVGMALKQAQLLGRRVLRPKQQSARENRRPHPASRYFYWGQYSRLR